MTLRGYLVDTHVLIWSLYEQAKLTKAHRDVLTSDFKTCVSVATIWEIEIKKQAGRLSIPDAIWDQAADVGHVFLPIEPQHARLAGSLPTVHGDPFDRMLVAQAIIGNLGILTVDRAMKEYAVETI